MACLNPSESFVAFDKQRLIRLVQFYPQDFSLIELMILNDQLETYIINVRNGQFSNSKGIGDLSKKKRLRQKNTLCIYLFMYSLVYFINLISFII